MALTKYGYSYSKPTTAEGNFVKQNKIRAIIKQLSPCIACGLLIISFGCLIQYKPSSKRLSATIS